MFTRQRSPLAAPDCKVITESVMPRLYNVDYYTVPSIVELAVRESDEPGYCSHVKDFTVGRRGYGSVKFDGETDVRKLDIASIVEFNDREILVYRDESKTPPVGQELNKPAEVTLLNVKCIDQKTGLQFTEGADGRQIQGYSGAVYQGARCRICVIRCGKGRVDVQG